jgi:alkylation response protein AidB-like acyl-CoA dehydrogenase
VNGSKKWITSGTFSDFFTVAVRTSPDGMNGLSLLVLEKSMPGIKVRHMKCGGLWTSGTAFVDMEDVKVPVENLIGVEGMGWKYITKNFNHERFIIIVQAIRLARMCFEEAFRYASRRKTFGQILIQNPVIRNKLGHMIRQIEATQNWLENMTYQMMMLPKEEADSRLGGNWALLKVQTTITLEYCAREASQIFGGLGYSRGGAGEIVERIFRDVRAISIFGGSEEVMCDFGVRQIMKSKI